MSDSFDIASISDTETDIAEADWDPDFRKNQERKSLIKRILKECGKDDGKRKPLNVAVIGPAGVGKSAFINTVAASLSTDKWREYAYSGAFGTGTGQITVFTDSFSKCCKAEEYPDYLLPTLIDVAGFADEYGEQFVELLRILFYGRLPVGESLREAADYYKEFGLSGLRQKYSKNNEKLKVDRVIFLTSAMRQVPDSLIRCVVEAARPPGTIANPWKRTLPLYGVMLKFDKVLTTSDYERRKKSGADMAYFIEESEYEKRETKFIEALGLGGSRHRFLRCSNYCDDVDPTNSRIESVIPDLDLPVLRLLTQVTDGAMKVMNEAETYNDGNNVEDNAQPQPEVKEADTTQNRMSPKRHARNQFIDYLGAYNVSLLMTSVEAVFVAFILTFLIKPEVNMANLKAACHMENLPNPFRVVCRDLQNPNFASQMSNYLALAALVGLRMAVTFISGRLFRRG